MEFYCAVDFDEPDIQKHVFEDFESIIASMKEEYYSTRGQEYVQNFDDIYAATSDGYHS